MHVENFNPPDDTCPYDQGIILLASGRLLNDGGATGHGIIVLASVRLLNLGCRQVTRFFYYVRLVQECHLRPQHRRYAEGRT